MTLLEGRRTGAGLSGRYVRLVASLRFLIVPGWILLAAYTYHAVPALNSTSSRSGLASLVGRTSPAIEAQISAVHRFSFPLLAQTVIVQHRAKGLSPGMRANLVARAGDLNAHKLHGLSRIAGAIPVTNAHGSFPSSSQTGTTALTFLFYRRSVGTGTQMRLTRSYERRYLSGPGSGLVGATGAVPAQSAQGDQIGGSLATVELATIALVVVVMGITFRSVMAPVIAVASAGVAYFLSIRILSLASAHLGISVPGELDPVIVVLLLGIMTDYSVFFLSGFRDELRSGHEARTGFLRSAARVAPIVATAGFTVAASLSMIMTAHLALFSDLGPGLAITVFVGVTVAVSFLPAAVATFGRATYWPSRPRPRNDGQAGSPGLNRARRSLRARLERLTVRPPLAAGVLLVGVGVLAAAGSPLRGASLGVNLVSALPPSSTPARAAVAASKGFAPGIIAPTEVLVDAPGMDRRRSDLAGLQSLIAHQRGVAGVLGPADKLGKAVQGALVSKDGDAARFLVVLDDPPFGARAVTDLGSLRAHMSRLVSQAGLSGARTAYAGDTALSAEVAKASGSDLVRVGLFTLGVDFLILALFLRAFLAPLILVVASALVVAAGFGITTWVFTGVLGTAGFTFYVPFAAEVLLISFGSDYNLYLVGRIWQTARHAGLRPAIARASAEASFAINVAGVTLAGSFALLALVGLGSFHQLALAMFAGLALDTFFVRTFLVPSVLSLLGRAGRWPGRGGGR